MKTLIIIWSLVVIMGLGVLGWANYEINQGVCGAELKPKTYTVSTFDRKPLQGTVGTAPTYNPQPAGYGTTLQGTVQGPYLRYGYNPQQAAEAF